MNMKSPSHHDVVVHALQGDAAAFGSLVRHYQGSVCAIALGVTRDVATSEDVAQDVFLTAWARRESLTQPVAFASWIRTIARNKSREYLRSNARRLSRVHPNEAAVQQAQGEQPEVLDQLVKAEDLEALSAALDSLPEGAREVLVLYYREGQSIRQVSEQLDLGEPAVRKRLSRARQLLRADVTERVADTLQRTRPGAALSAAILLCIDRGVGVAAVGGAAQDQGTAFSSTSDGRTLQKNVLLPLVAALVLGGLALVASQVVSLPNGLGSGTGAGVGPADTVRHDRSVPPLVPRTNTTGGEVGTSPESHPEFLTVRVGRGDRIHRTLVYQPEFAPSDWFPMPDEAPLPDTPATEALQQLLDFQAREGRSLKDQEVRAQAEEVVHLAHDEGLLPLERLAADDDPWVTLVGLEMARLEAWTSLAQDQSVPPADLIFTELADRLASRSEQTALADYGRLYALEARLYRSGESRSEEAAAVVSSTLLQTADSRVIAHALLSVPILAVDGDLRLPPELIESTVDAVARIEHPHERWAASLVMAEQALIHNSEEGVRQWMALAKDSTESVVDIDSPFVEFLQESINRETPKIGAQLADLTGQAHSDWRGSIAASVWDCHRAQPANESHIAKVHYDGSWTWDQFEPAGSFASCVMSAVPDQPVPSVGTEITLRVQLQP